LTGRKQRVKVKGSASKWMDVISGVPQGSVLGPILFVFYINDIVDNLACDAYMYANDMKIYNRVKNNYDKQLLQNDINMVVDWTDAWLLRLNISKCKVLTVGKNDYLSHQYNVTVNGNVSTLDSISQEKDLGCLLIAACNLTSMCKKLSKKQTKFLELLNVPGLQYASFAL
jgi:hypothetical protein